LQQIVKRTDSIAPKADKSEHIYENRYRNEKAMIPEKRKKTISELEPATQRRYIHPTDFNRGRTQPNI